MRSLLLVILAALLAARRRPGQEAADAQRYRRRRAGERVADDRSRRPAGHRPGERRAGRDPARAAIRAGPRRQRQAAGARQLLGRRDRLSRAGQLCRAMGAQRERPAVARRRRRQAAGRIYARRSRGLRSSRSAIADPYAPRAGFVDGWPIAYSPRRAGPTSPIAMAASGSAATCRPTPARAANFTRSSAMPRASSTAISPWSAGSSTASTAQLAAARDGGAGLLQGQAQVRADRADPARQRHAGRRAARLRIYGHQQRDVRAVVRLRANRKDDFYDRPAGGVDLCNVQVPVQEEGLA